MRFFPGFPGVPGAGARMRFLYRAHFVNRISFTAHIFSIGFPSPRTFFYRISFAAHILVVGWLVGLCRRAERPRRVRAEVPCGGFARVVSPPLTSSQRVLSVDFSLGFSVLRMGSRGVVLVWDSRPVGWGPRVWSRIQGFQWYALTDIGISVVRSNGYRDFSGTQ